MQNKRNSTIQESPANHAFFNLILCMKAILFIRQRQECAIVPNIKLGEQSTIATSVFG